MHASVAFPRRGPRRGRGFTLIEMLVVVLIVGILASAVLPLAELNRRRAQEAELRSALRTIRLALDAYRVDCLGNKIKCTGSITDKAGSGFPPDLQTLVQGVEDTSTAGLGSGKAGVAKRRYYLRRLPRDPFADPLLTAAETWGLRSYDSPPDAPEPGKDVYDVYSMSDGTALDGTPYRSW